MVDKAHHILELFHLFEFHVLLVQTVLSSYAYEYIGFYLVVLMRFDELYKIVLVRNETVVAENCVEQLRALAAEFGYVRNRRQSGSGA